MNVKDLIVPIGSEAVDVPQEAVEANAKGMLQNALPNTTFA